MKYYYWIDSLGIHDDYFTHGLRSPKTYWSDLPWDFRCGSYGGEVETFRDCHLLGII